MRGKGKVAKRKESALGAATPSERGMQKIFYSPSPPLPAGTPCAKGANPRRDGDEWRVGKSWPRGQLQPQRGYRWKYFCRGRCPPGQRYLTPWVGGATHFQYWWRGWWYGLCWPWGKLRPQRGDPEKKITGGSSLDGAPQANGATGHGIAAPPPEKLPESEEDERRGGCV